MHGAYRRVRERSEPKYKPHTLLKHSQHTLPRWKPKPFPVRLPPPLHSAQQFKCTNCNKHPLANGGDENIVHIKCTNVHCPRPYQIACRTCMNKNLCVKPCRACHMSLPEEIENEDEIPVEDPVVTKVHELSASEDEPAPTPPKCPTCHCKLFNMSLKDIVAHITHLCTHHPVHCTNHIKGCPVMVTRSPGTHPDCSFAS